MRWTWVWLGLTTACRAGTGLYDQGANEIPPPETAETAAADEPANPLGLEDPGTPAPIYGGTIDLRHNRVVVADPDGDTVSVWDMAEKVQLGMTQLERGARPFRVAIAWDRALVTLRGTGEVITVELDTGTVTGRQWVCPAPRGVGWFGDRAFVACAGGELVDLTLDLELQKSWMVAPDLRDVVLHRDVAWVSRFRSAEVFKIDRYSKEVLGVYRPAMEQTLQPDSAPRVAWRLRGVPGSDDVAMLHQAAAQWPLDGDLPDIDKKTLPEEPVTPVYYGLTPCDPDALRNMLSSHITIIDGESGDVRTGGGIRGGSLLVDVAMTGPDSGYLAAVSAAGRPDKGVGLHVPSATGDPLCTKTTMGSGFDGVVTSVAVDPEGEVPRVFYARAPSKLRGFGHGLPLLVPTPSEHWSALTRFHRDAGNGVTCAHCHPEAQDDGHTWQFRVGPKRTQNLAGGVSQRAPFHWNGEHSSFVSLMDDVFTERMGGDGLLLSEVDQLADWLDDIPSVAGSADPARVERGEAVFRDPSVGCSGCHWGPQYTDRSLHEVVPGRPATKTPSLLGVGTRPPYMSDGCALTLWDRLEDPECGGGDQHGVTSHLDASDRQALVAFLTGL